ncbi:hypothetical protein DAEQUDRAFT_457837 [Daedalea quercina L-15889]|uniref:Uncharacterized protein n=1 Tax=Daedalea quercina L-15889 TaxID=1314783 RepID=A0A165N1G1_9APHY|nr:hypothetical protein DAEQUDRAFT_457837 [Daedalea quercina L-15889]
MITVKRFRPFCTRVPLGRDKGMSNSNHIALEVDDFKLPGSFNEPAWGTPMPVETRPDIHEWIKGLRQGGGAGNILKLRKTERPQDAEAAVPVDNGPALVGLIQQHDRPLNVIPRKTKLAARKTAPAKPLAEIAVQQPNTTRAIPHVKLDPEGAYKEKWKSFSANKKYLPVSDDIKRRLRALPVNQAEVAGTVASTIASGVLQSTSGKDGVVHKPSMNVSTPPRERRRLDAQDLDTSEPSSPPSRHSDQLEGQPEPLPATPSHWSPSNRGSPRADLATLDDIEEGVQGDVTGVTSDTSSPVPPRGNGSRVLVSQEDNGSPVPKVLSAASLSEANCAMALEPTSSYLSAPTPAQRPRPVPSSSSPPLPASTAQEVSVSVVPESPLAAPSSSALLIAAAHLLHQRRMPRPICNRLSPDPNISGPGRILVPNSDTSASLSQDQPFSQQSQQDSSSQSKCQEQKRSLQSLSYASGSQTDKSQNSQQSQLRNEVAAASGEDPRADTVMADVEMNMMPEPSQSRHNSSSPIPAQASPQNAPDQRPGSNKLDETSDHAPPERVSPRSKSKASKPSQEVVPDSESETGEEDTGDEQVESVVRVRVAVSHRSPPLDSDDERTKTMAATYTSRRKLQPRAEKTRQTSSTTTMQVDMPNRKDHSAVPWRPSGMDASAVSLARSDSSDLPLPPSSPDVFMSEDSFRASNAPLPRNVVRSSNDPAAQPIPRNPTTPVRDTHRSGSTKGLARDTGSSDRTRVDQPPPPTHDPEAWKEPSFMRKPTSIQRERSPPMPVVGNRTNQAKRAGSVSSDTKPEGPPQKKHKTSTTSAARTSGWVKAVRHEMGTQQMKSATSAPPPPDKRPALPASSSHPHSTAGSAIAPKQPDLRRSVSVLSSARSIPKKRPGAGRSTSSDKSGSARPEIKVVRQLSPGGSTPVEVKQVDFAPGSRRSSQTSISKARTKSRAPGDAAIPTRRSQPTSSSRDGGPPSERRSMAVEPGPSTKRGVQTAQTHKDSGGPSSASSSADPSKETAAPQPERLLGGYEVNFHLTAEEGGPQLVTWSRLQQILLKTGRARHKQKMQHRE